MNSARIRRKKVETNESFKIKRKNTLVDECMLKSLKMVIHKANNCNDETPYPECLPIPETDDQFNDEVCQVDDISTEIFPSEDIETDPYLALDCFYSFSFATILEEVLQSVNILEECNNSMRIRKVQQDMPTLLARKYGILPEVHKEIAELESRDEIKRIMLSDLECYAYKLDKMVNDSMTPFRKTFYNVIMETYKSLAVRQGFKSLWNHLKDVDEVKGREYLLEIDEANNKMTARNLRRQKRHQCNQHKSAQYEFDGIIEELRAKIEDADAMKEIKCRYVDRWQNARTRQHQMTIKFEQDEQTNSTEYYKRRSELERVVHQEVDMFINIAIHETLDKVDKAMEKYETNLEAIDLKIQISRNNYLEALEKRQMLEETYKKHAKVIIDWVQFKDQREKFQKDQKERERAAIIVQGWWRGIIVRLKLGPFRPATLKSGRKRRKSKKL